MKKTFVLCAALLLLPLAARGQEIAFDTIQGVTRAKGTDYMIFDRPGNADAGISLAVYTNMETSLSEYVLGLYLEGEERIFIPKDGKAVLNTFTGEVVTLELRDFTESLERGGESFTRGKKILFCVKPSFDISDEDLRTLLDRGISRIMIQAEGADIICTFRKDKLGDYLRSEKNCLSL